MQRRILPRSGFYWIKKSRFYLLLNLDFTSLVSAITHNDLYQSALGKHISPQHLEKADSIIV